MVRNNTQNPRDVFFGANPSAPWICFVCGEEMYQRSAVDVHHIDMEHRNNRISNLDSVHPYCHKEWHNRLKALAAEAIELFEPISTV